MTERPNLYIDGAWSRSEGVDTFWAIDPSTEQRVAEFGVSSEVDVDRAVAAASKALPGWSSTSKGERIAALNRLLAAYQDRAEDLATALASEMGAPIDFARASQVPSGANHLRASINALEAFEFVETVGDDFPDQAVVREAIGVAALITPWNWPLYLITLKVGAALAAGCTMVLKPSEVSPLSGQIFAEIVDAAKLPRGVFNMVQGNGHVTGAALVAHPSVDVVSFTGSTKAGIAISKSAASAIKRVSLELGGKSPSIVFADADVEKAVKWTANSCFGNAGQSCNAATRLLVEHSIYDDAIAIAAQIARDTFVDAATVPGGHIGPLSSKAQFEKVQGCIEHAIRQGVKLVAGGPGRPDGKTSGHFARPTVFADVTSSYAIFHDEVFGPVLAITAFDDEDHAIALANDTLYGLSAYIHTSDPERIRRIGSRIRAGVVQFNGAGRAPGTPFGGYKQSGNGREGGRWGIEEFLEVKLVAGSPGIGRSRAA